MTITLIINGVDFSPVLSRFRVTEEISHSQVITTLSGEEIALGQKSRDVVSFALFPLTEEDIEIYYGSLKEPSLSAKYTKDGITSNQMRLASDLESAFLLDSVDGKRRYKGNEIVLRAIQTN
jgi:hypothetical protein